MKKFFAEFIGTFALVFAGTGAIVINETSGGAITDVGIALTFGLVVLAMIYTVGDISAFDLIIFCAPKSIDRAPPATSIQRQTRAREAVDSDDRFQRALPDRIFRTFLRAE